MIAPSSQGFWEGAADAYVLHEGKAVCGVWGWLLVPVGSLTHSNPQEVPAEHMHCSASVS